MGDLHTIVFGGGCFWCVEAIFRRLKGVEFVTSGYAGGQTEDPSYGEVSGGDTGHAEVVKVDYDSHVIQLETLLDVFFSTHDPTTLNKQGADVGEEYRSVILFSDQYDQDTIREYISALEESKTFENPIVTEVEQLGMFYEAEDHHKDFYELNKESSYCKVVIDPKIAKLRQKFVHILKSDT